MKSKIKSVCHDIIGYGTVACHASNMSSMSRENMESNTSEVKKELSE